MEEAPSTFHNQEQQGGRKYLGEQEEEQEWSWLAVITGGHFVC